jgi:PAS domain S-box-containing protein
MDSSRSRVQQSAKLATFTAFYCLSVNTSVSSFMVPLDLVLRLLFEMSYPFSIGISNSSLFPIPFFRTIRNLWTDLADPLNQQVTAYFMSFLVLSNVFYMAYLVHFYLTRRGQLKPHSTLVKVMQGHIYYSTGPLAVPYLAMILNHISCDTVDEKTCSFVSSNVGEAAYFILIAILHSVFIIVYECSVYEWSPVSQVLGAKAHHRVAIVTSVFRCLSTFLFTFFVQKLDMALQLGLIMYCLLYSLLITMCFVYQYPYYSIWMNFFHTSIYAVSFIASLAVLLSFVSSGNGDIVCVGLFIVGASLILPTVYSLIRWRLNSVDSVPVTTLRREIDIDVKVRLLMSKLLASNDNETEVQQDDTLAEIENVCAHHSKNFKGSFLFNQVWATYLFTCKQNRFFAMTKLRQILNNSPFIFDIVPIQIRLRFVSSYANSDGSEEDLLTYEEQVRLERVSVESMSKCLSSQLRFWGALVSEDYNLEKFERLSREINKFTELSRLSLQRMVALNPKSLFYRRLYSQFLLNIANDEASARRQLTRAMELESEEEASYTLTDSSNCILIISGERDNMGQILEANNRTCEVFGVSSEDIIGRKINMLMAKPYAAAHNSRMINYINTKQANLSTVNRTLVLKGSNGVAFEGQIQVREYPNFTLDPSISFFGAIKPLKDRNFCVVKISDMMLVEVSGQFLAYFSIDLQQIKNYECNMSRVLPQFADIVKDVEKEMTSKTEHRHRFKYSNSSGIEIELKLSITYLPYLPKEYFLIVHTRIRRISSRVSQIPRWTSKAPGRSQKK